MIDALKGPEFARKFGLQPQALAWFLGAGASAAAGIPTGYAMIADFRKRIFCELSNVPQREVDANDPLWQQRIDQLLRTRSTLPPAGDPTEYSKAFEAVFSTPDSRRAYIEDAIRNGTPSFAHRVLASLLTTKRIPCVFTTNFDPMIETAAIVTDQLMPAGERALLTVAAIDSAARAERCMRESAWPLLAKLHGDYQSIELKNTDAELKAQDNKMRSVLTGACTRFGLVVVGYSGRDESIMQTLRDVLQLPNPFPGGLYWVVQPGRPPLPAVTQLLLDAGQAGVSTFTIESHNFDELAADIADEITLPTAMAAHVFQARPTPVVSDVPLPTQQKRKFPILQCSALRLLSLPTAARRIELPAPLSTVRARELIQEAKVRAVVAGNGRELAAFGSDADLLKVFGNVGGQLSGTVELRPEVDSWARGLLYDALARALSRRQPLFTRLRRKGHLLLVQGGRADEPHEVTTRRESQLAALKNAYPSALVGKVKSFDYPYYEGVQIRLDRVSDCWWCVFEPTTYVDLPRQSVEAGSDEDAEKETTTPASRTDPLADWRRERWAQRYNPIWSRIMAAWASLLTERESGFVRAYDLTAGAGVNAEFKLSPKLAWSRPSHDHDYFLRGGR
ncbi:MAG TPA: SIR2 family protein [Polyangiaceae bacterium]